ncbi:hypothetical protein RIF29_10308 [Crotalaria pallida]|uniref:Uncharacterized protein n=1 Tax=Crotalaria pallida TaxID=3830 RepID=A0AAN9FV47_CROPI
MTGVDDRPRGGGNGPWMVHVVYVLARANDRLLPFTVVTGTARYLDVPKSDIDFAMLDNPYPYINPCECDTSRKGGSTNATKKKKQPKGRSE